MWIGGGLYDITPADASPILDSGGNPILDSDGNPILDSGSGFAAGNIDGTAGIGYGTGAYGEGYYGEPIPGTDFPLTWSLAPWGQNLMACPRGQTIYQWTNDTGTPAAAAV